jgi:hypothetical protein
MDTIIAAVISASVVAAIVSGFVTLTEQRRQFADAKRNRFLDLKRERYAQFTAAVSAWVRLLQLQRTVSVSIGPNGEGGPVPTLTDTTHIDELAEEIGLLAPPSVTRLVVEVARTVFALGPFAVHDFAPPRDQVLASQVEFRSAANRVNAARLAFAYAAKRDLGTDIDPDAGRRRLWGLWRAAKPATAAEPVSQSDGT